MAGEDTEGEIRRYLESHKVCRLAISDGNMPSAHTVYYVSKGLHIYFSSEPGSQKISILQSNPRLSLTVDEEYDDWRNIKGVQIFGSAEVKDESVSVKLRQAFLKKFPHIKELGGIPMHHIFVEVIPEKAYYLDFTKKFGHKTVHYIDEKAQKVTW
ncbi:MAG: pyridoxamine 5'-phosphate oxidase family protein [Candidatus Altiarchaeota archaeon]